MSTMQTPHSHDDKMLSGEIDILEQARMEELALARELVRARNRAGMTQREVAERMGTVQPAIARLERGHKPSLKTLERYARATGSKLKIALLK